MTETKAKYSVNRVRKNAADHSMEMLTVLHDVEEYLQCRMSLDITRKDLLAYVREVLDRVQRVDCEHDWELVERYQSVGGHLGYEIYKCEKCGLERYNDLYRAEPIE